MLAEINPGKTHIKGEVIDFTQHECGSCGICFFAPTRWLKDRIQTQGSYHCPNGCSRRFVGKSEAQLLKEQISELKTSAEKEREEMQNRLLDEMNAKKKVERQLKRVNKGFCPCCNRTFSDLQRHMQSRHPDKVSK